MESHELDDALTLGVRQMAAEARDKLEGHPSPDDLLAYDAGKLEASERARVREHLAVCPKCARTVLDLASFPEIEPAPGVEPLSAEAEEAQWQRVLDGVEEEEAHRATGRGWGGIHLLAAVLAGVSLGLALWVTWLYVQPGSPEALRANVFEIDLSPVGASVARSQNGVRVPAGMGAVLLRLNLADLRPFDDVRVTAIRERESDGIGGVVWERQGLVRGPQGNFSVYFSREALPAGRYRIELVGERGGRFERLAAYELELHYEQ